MEFLVIVHIIGTVLGVGAATFAEVYYIKFNQDNIVSDDERKTLATTYTILRFGLFLVVVSGFGFFLNFRLTEHVGALMSPALWAKMTLVVVLVVNAWLLQVRKVPLAIGSAISLTSWYGALILGVIGRTLVTTYHASFVDIMLGYVAAIVLVGLALKWIRARFRAPRPV